MTETATAPQSSRAPADGSVVAARAVTRRYGEGDTAVDALRGVSLDVARGELTAVMGPSGSGKSTLMHILAGLDRPTSGEVFVDGTSIGRLGDTELTKLRRRHIGFVFQFFNLLPMLTAEENVVLPLSIAGETTGNLDSATSEEILHLMRASVDGFGQTTVMVTHDPRAAAIADRILFLADGLIVRELPRSDPADVLAVMNELNAR